jgi:transcriptional regulator with XRE-family HTH domain
VQTCCEYLNIIFDLKRKRNSKYSLRAFARDCGINSGRMSQYLSGQRLLTNGMIKKIGTNLNFSDNELELFLSLYKKDKKSIQIEAHLLKEIYHPVCFHILSLFETENFQDEIGFIASRLGISEEQAASYLETLEKSNLIKKNDSGKRTLCYDVIRTSANVPNAELRQSHKLSLTKIIELIDTVDVKDREMTSVTLCVDPILLPKAKKKISDFVEKLAVSLESGRKKEVYELNVQLVPMTKPIRRSL